MSSSPSSEGSQVKTPQTITVAPGTMEEVMATLRESSRSTIVADIITIIRDIIMIPATILAGMTAAGETVVEGEMAAAVEIERIPKLRQQGGESSAFKESATFKLR